MSDIQNFDPFIVDDSVRDIISHNLSYERLVDLDIPLERFSRDNNPVNNYRYRLINLCKSTGLCIANGRCASDKRIGSKTCDDKSLLDY